MPSPSCHILIVAAGSGTRLGADQPKQYLDLGGISVLRRTIAAFQAHPLTTSILVVINPAHREMYEAAVDGLALPAPVAGGATRQESVRAGLEALAAQAGSGDYVLIHDAARPFVSARTIDNVIAALDTHEGAIAARPVVDTLKKADSESRIAATIPRDHLWRAETPQAFRLRAILDAHRQFAGQALTDDAALAEAAGLVVKLVVSNVENFKITTEDDMVRARKLTGDSAMTAQTLMTAQTQASAYEYRTGFGFDVHELIEGDGVTLCGIVLPHNRRLKGHSDADVGLHALTDALLGTIGAGDIGEHFPPSDPRWKGAESGQFLTHAAKLVAAAGGRIVNVDITILAEQPKIGPHRDLMRARIAGLLGISVGAVGIKATTTEKLGFTGREEGIAAQAVASVELPRRAA